MLLFCFSHVCAYAQEVAKRSTTYKSTEEEQNEEDDDDEVEEENIFLQQVRSFVLSYVSEL